MNATRVGAARDEDDSEVVVPVRDETSTEGA